ncbi:MAG: mechanosensitive ion channel family protein [Candidatus Nanopelagicales bacterium]|jgi:moderate conductance mechanosensitive channel|nr:mechanosensitive ion channel family protein [Candidatus Nanopelagicales bacterium]MDP4895725.1 mechanosensitive ion channel family protein [Candidatus Nanopelagicales bacterium]MDP5050561.1 mechanosensitive ion channel family protein [Candidatus Nanopelagicales bacterium]
MDSKEVLTWFLGQPVKVAIVVIFALAARLVLLRAVDRLTKRALGSSSRSDQRAATVSRLLHGTISSTVWIIALITVLAIVGINVGPLLASAGILGVALGFGAQALVKDYISGIFLILEDQFGLGDEVEIGAIRGTVEDVALRVTQVRDSDGRLWYIRNGEIFNVANHNRKN